MIGSAYVDDLQIHITPEYFLTKVTGIGGSPVPRAVTSDRSQDHGVIDLTRFYSGRVIGLEGVCIGTDTGNAWELMDNLKGKLALGSQHVFKFQRSGLPDAEQCVVRVSGGVEGDQENPSKVIPWSAIFLAADPRFYGASLKSGNYDPTISSTGGGVTLPITFPLMFSVSTLAQLSLINAGNFPSPPVFTIHGPIVNPVLDNDTTNEHIYSVANLGVDDVLVIDVADRLVTLNGAARPDLLQSMSTVWWQMVKGENLVRLRGTGMVPGVTLLTTQFRDARI